MLQSAPVSQCSAPCFSFQKTGQSPRAGILRLNLGSRYQRGGDPRSRNDARVTADSRVGFEIQGAAGVSIASHAIHCLSVHGGGSDVDCDARWIYEDATLSICHDLVMRRVGQLSHEGPDDLPVRSGPCWTCCGWRDIPENAVCVCELKIALRSQAPRLSIVWKWLRCGALRGSIRRKLQRRRAGEHPNNRLVFFECSPEGLRIGRARC
jgi:hypothetical protein